MRSRDTATTMLASVQSAHAFLGVNSLPVYEIGLSAEVILRD